jgi:hypothetical protein
MIIWLVEQDVNQLRGEYLTEAVVLARSRAAAKAAVLSLAEEFGLVVNRGRLSVTALGNTCPKLPKLTPRHCHRGAQVLVVGTGTDDE